jgi:hypothetical protein
VKAERGGRRKVSTKFDAVNVTEVVHYYRPRPLISTSDTVVVATDGALLIILDDGLELTRIKGGGTA